MEKPKLFFSFFVALEAADPPPEIQVQRSGVRRQKKKKKRIYRSCVRGIGEDGGLDSAKGQRRQGTADLPRAVHITHST